MSLQEPGKAPGERGCGRSAPAVEQREFGNMRAATSVRWPIYFQRSSSLSGIAARHLVLVLVRDGLTKVKHARR